MVYKQHRISSRTLSKKETNLVEQIDEIFPLIEDAIENARNGKLVDGNENQLLKIKQELIEMSNCLSPKDYMPGFGHAIADSWDSDSKLGNLLLDIICKYKNL